MGTHPIFESDFDCLTDNRNCIMNRYLYDRNVELARSDSENVDMDICVDSQEGNWSGWINGKGNTKKSDGTSNVASLYDLCSKVVAQTSPFELVQNFYPPVPEHS